MNSRINHKNIVTKKNRLSNLFYVRQAVASATFFILSSTGISMKYLIQQYIKEKMVLLVLVSLLDLAILIVVHLTMPQLSVVIPVCIAAGINVLQWVALRFSTEKINKTKYADILKEES